MTFPHGSLQQVRLIPVIATLLQFTDEDLQGVVQASPAAPPAAVAMRRAPTGQSSQRRGASLQRPTAASAASASASMFTRISTFLGLSPKKSPQRTNGRRPAATPPVNRPEAPKQRQQQQPQPHPQQPRPEHAAGIAPSSAAPPLPVEAKGIVFSISAHTRSDGP